MRAERVRRGWLRLDSFVAKGSQWITKISAPPVLDLFLDILSISDGAYSLVVS